MLAAVVADKTGALTFWGAWLFVGARAAFLPLYAFHLGMARSLAWFVSIGGLRAVTAALFV